MINKTELTDIAHNIDQCSSAVTRVMTAIIETGLEPCDIEHCMQTISSNLDDEHARLQSIIDSMADDGTKGADNDG